jgi:hypothetical protein
MTVADRNKQLRIVAEMLLVHLPALLNPQHAPARGAFAGDQTSQVDQSLVRDLLTVVSLAIRAAADDVEKSAAAWDKRAYHLRADELRREWEWASGAANYATGLADRAQPVTHADLEKLCALIGVELEHPKRLHYKNPVAFRGAREANRRREQREGRRTPKRSLV